MATYVLSGTPDASAQSSQANKKSDVAAVDPADGAKGWAGDGLPALLDEEDAARYRVLFQLQEEGDWAGADKIVAKLDNRALMGHVLAQRYLHPTAYRSKYIELKEWLDLYADHPDAHRIHALALKRRPANAKMPKAPLAPKAKSASESLDLLAYDRQAFESKVYTARKKLNAVERREHDRYLSQFNWFLRKGWTLSFKKQLAVSRVKELLHPVEYDRQQARLAAGYYAAGRDEWALDWARRATRRSGKYLPEAHWTAGLAAWRLSKFDEAAPHFEAVAESEYSSRWLVSAGSFWAARAHIRQRHTKDFVRLMGRASEFPRTFYGLLARRFLGHDTDLDWAPPPLAERALRELAAAPAGGRAVMLLQIGDEARAERELRGLDGRSSKELAQAMLALAERAQMPTLAMRLGNMLLRNGSAISDSTAYPAPPLILAGGEIIDRELILALIRQESGFNPNARSHAGARGLMQIMPGTANYIARGAKLGALSSTSLYDPEVNLALGQRYIDILLKEPAIDGDLFRMVAAWNAGPGNLARWMKEVKHGDDPLLFIESIPSRETRIFAERVLTNYWIYRQRFSQPTHSLDAVAAGKWPIYHSDRSDSVEVAQDGPEK